MLAKLDAQAVLDVLRRSPRQARFVPELQAALRPLAPTALESALVDLEAAGQVIVRDHTFSDPHVEGTDLRVVGLVASSSDADPQAAAIDNIERTWEHWLNQYLANHRCS
jgi:hypothetical protein